MSGLLAACFLVSACRWITLWVLVLHFWKCTSMVAYSRETLNNERILPRSTVVFCFVPDRSFRARLSWSFCKQTKFVISRASPVILFLTAVSALSLLSLFTITIRLLLLDFRLPPTCTSVALCLFLACVCVPISLFVALHILFFVFSLQQTIRPVFRSSVSSAAPSSSATCTLKIGLKLVSLAPLQSWLRTSTPRIQHSGWPAFLFLVHCI